jgi:hypothetical protein
MPDSDFAALIAWLDDRVGKRVAVSLTGPSERTSNVGLHAEGALRRRDVEIILIDPSPGQVAAFGVGDAVLVLLEGDLIEVEFDDGRTFTPLGGGSFEIPASASADFGDVVVLFSDGRSEA